MILPEKLDLIFPYFVFGYGVVMTLVLQNPKLMELAEMRFPAELVQQMKAHRVLGLICLVVGGLWSVQNLWMH